jgi:hypothetical protein
VVLLEEKRERENREEVDEDQRKKKPIAPFLSSLFLSFFFLF